MSPRRSEADRRIAAVEAIKAIEAIVCRDVGRSTQALITGFFVPRGEVAAPETDGPVGTALLAAALAACGVPARIAVDTPCAVAVRMAVEATGIDVAVDEVGVDDRAGIDRLIDAW